MAQSGSVKPFPFNSKNKKDLEKQKKIVEEEEAAAVYEQFVETFEKPNQVKQFVRANAINPGSGAEIETKDAGKFYKYDKLEELEKLKYAKNEGNDTKRINHSKHYDKPQKKKDVKKKSNLEEFKEELKMRQEEREGKFSGRASVSKEFEDTDDSRSKVGSHDTGDPTTTNIYLGNINPKLKEDKLCEIFGRYGPLASVKIMWPRSDDERTRSRNCGFVAFMCRIDSERALKAIDGKKVMDYEMKLGWGKAIPIPANPMYVPPALRELLVSPPKSGLPFNAQVVNEEDKKILEKYEDPQILFKEDRATFDDLLSRTVVKVITPSDKAILCSIHRVIEFVIREGPLFEALIMNREANNKHFNFLFDNQSPEHVYYRWRLFSLLQGDSTSSWSEEPFRMYKNGSIWEPPKKDVYTKGMPEDLLPDDDDEDSISIDNVNKRRSKSSDSSKKGTLSERLREKFEDLLRSLTPTTPKVGELMVFCIQHADYAEEIIEAITDSLCIPETPLHKKIARLYLLSDILHNCSVKVSNVSNYRKGFHCKMVSIFEAFNSTYNQIESRLKAENFKVTLF